MSKWRNIHNINLALVLLVSLLVLLRADEGRVDGWDVGGEAGGHDVLYK